MVDPIEPGDTTDPADPEAVDLTQAFIDQDPRQLNPASIRLAATAMGMTVGEVNAFITEMGRKWAEFDAEDEL